jgi:hypothetical protein
MKMRIPLVDRPLTRKEVERIRLILSTYQDGTGMLAIEGGGTLPGWRDFERAVAAALGGVAQESKAVFDVVLHSPTENNRALYGISCKMRRELNRVKKDNRVTIEVSNAAGEFWRALEKKAVTKENFSSMATEAGRAIIEVVDGWHQAGSIKSGGKFDVDSSSYLVLLWNTGGDYQLFQFPLKLFDAACLKWSVPKAKKDPTLDSRRLCGFDGAGNAVEWYGSSGGQLKLYPLASSAIWKSDRFYLEKLPEGLQQAASKAESYFPEKWKAAHP